MPKNKLQIEDDFLKKIKNRISKDVKAYNKYAKAKNKTIRLGYVEAEVYPEDIADNINLNAGEELPASFNFDKYVLQNQYEGNVTGVNLSAPNAIGWFPSSCDYNGS